MRTLLYFVAMAQVAAWLVTLERFTPQPGAADPLPPTTLLARNAAVRVEPTDWATVQRGLRRCGAEAAARQLPTAGPVDRGGYRKLEPVLAGLDPAGRRVVAGACP